MVSCYNAKTGEPYYHQQRLPKTYSFKSSPVGANGKLYLASENDDVIVVKMGEKFEVLATNTMADQTFIATPAIAGGEIFLRSKTRLYCIRGKSRCRRDEVLEAWSGALGTWLQSHRYAFGILRRATDRAGPRRAGRGTTW